MKKIIIISALIFLNLQSMQLLSTNRSKFRRDSSFCLEITGQINNAFEGSLKECKVELITSEGIIDSIFLEDGQRRFRFVLKRNMYYAILVSKPGYHTKLISIDTRMIGQSAEIYNFSFDTDLLSEETATFLNADALDFPIAIIHFNKEGDCFQHNKEYTKYIKREIYNNYFVASRAGAIASVNSTRN